MVVERYNDYADKAKERERNRTRSWFQEHSTPERLKEIEKKWEKEDEASKLSEDDSDDSIYSD